MSPLQGKSLSNWDNIPDRPMNRAVSASNLISRGEPEKSIKVSASVNLLGIQGYRVPYNGLSYKYPDYSIPKDQNTTYFKHVTRHSVGKPAPTHYYKPLSWTTSSSKFGVGSKRKTFTDEAVAHSKVVPAPTRNDKMYKDKANGGCLEKTEGVDYLSDC